MVGEEQQNVQHVLQGWEQFNAHDISSFIAQLAPSYRWISDTLPRTIVGKEETRQALEMFFKTLPDTRFEVEQTFSVGDYVIVRFVARGTKTDGFMGLPPTDKPFEYHGCAVNRFTQDERMESWVYWDRQYVLEQLGALPPQLGQANGHTLATEHDAAVSPDEEVIVRYGVGEGNILQDPQYITLHITMFKADGTPGGYYKGIQQAAGPFNLQQLMAKPPMPPAPIDQPQGIPTLPIGGNYKSTWWFNDQDSITAVGPSNPFLAPLRDGSMIFMTTAMGLITGGTGQYEGASGVKSAVGSGLLPPGATFAPGTSFHAKTLDIFRVVKQAQQAPLSAVARASVSTPSGAPSGMPPLPPTFPPGVNPETYRIETVTHLLRQAAYFSLFSMPNPTQPNKPIVKPGVGMIGVEVHEDLHRFNVQVEQPTAHPRQGIRAINQVGQPVAQVHIDWRPIPDDYVASPDKEPPPTPLDPMRSQRFVMLGGQFRFNDGRQSGFHGFGTGRTFPTMINGQPQLRIGAVIDILEGYGRLAGKQGTVVVNGYITPPDGLALNILVRVLDPSGDLLTSSALPPVRPIPAPDPGSTFLMFLGEEDTSKPTTLRRAPDGRMLGASVHERLRLVHLNFDISGRAGLRSHVTTGPVVGTLSGSLIFNPFAAAPGAPVPFQTQDGVFTFFDRQGKTVGSLKANIVEGRGFTAELPGAPMPVFRFGGFGPFLQGEGMFDGAIGMMSLNAAISVFPRTLSNLYVLRISDPDHKFRAAWS